MIPLPLVDPQMTHLFDLPDELLRMVFRHLQDRGVPRATCHRFLAAGPTGARVRLQRHLSSRHETPRCVVDGCEKPCFVELRLYTMGEGRPAFQLPSSPYCKLHTCAHFVCLSTGDVVLGRSPAASAEPPPTAEEIAAGDLDDANASTGPVCIVCL